MPFVILTFPFYSDYTLSVLERTMSLPDTRVALITHEPEAGLPERIRTRLQGHWEIPDIRDTKVLFQAVESLQDRAGQRVDHFFSPAEHCQTPAAQVRERLGLPGLSSEITLNYRDKVRMKDLFDRAGVPCARHARACHDSEAWAFASRVGYPIVLKPVDGAASQTTVRVDNPDALRDALPGLHISDQNQFVLEEFLTGEEHSIDAFWHRGERLFHTVTDYHPSCLEVMQTSWIQWVVILPREVEDPMYDDIREISRRAHEALGMDSGMTHTEWFRRPDGTVAISEIGARPPGAQFTTLISRAGGWDALTAWARLMVFDEIQVPTEVKYAAGIAYLRGQGQGTRVQAVHGWDRVWQEINGLITDYKIPPIGEKKSLTYEGEGFIIARHPETKVVEDALKWAVSQIRVDLG